MVVVGLTRGGRLLESLTAGLWLERCCAGKVLWIGIVVAWIMEGGSGGGGRRGYSTVLTLGWLAAKLSCTYCVTDFSPISLF